MSSITNLIKDLLMVIIGDGNVNSKQQGWLLIALDKVCKIVTDIAKS